MKSFLERKSKAIQPFLEKNVDEKRKAISPLIATILLVVVAVAIIMIIINWGKGFTQDSLDLIEVIYTPSNITGFIYQDKLIEKNLIIKNLHSTQEIVIVGYKINSLKKGEYLNRQITLENSIIVKNNNIGELSLICVPENEFYLELFLENNTFINLPIKTNNFNYLECIPTTFVSIWKTDNLSTGSSNDNQIKLPLESAGYYNFNVDWGDGTLDTITSWNQSEVTHTYESPGTYTIKIDGDIRGFRFVATGDRLKLLEISQWGNLQLGNNNRYFDGAENLRITAQDVLDLSQTTSMIYAFRNCKSLTTVPSMNDWNMSTITDLRHMFDGAHSFNQPIGNWDVSNVTRTRLMFDKAYNFNQSIEDWNTSKFTEMVGMFQRAINFNQPIGNWDVSNVNDMGWLFYEAHSFNQPLNDWNVSNVTILNSTFYDAVVFNQPLDNWDTSNVTTMRSLFGSFGDSEIFWYGELHQGEHTIFNQDISNWNVSKVTNMNNMFKNNIAFNQPLNNWDTSNVTTLENAFYGATSFDQPLDNWDVSKVTNMTDLFYGIELSTGNYDSILTSWANQPVQSDINLNAGDSKYSSAAASAREDLINIYSWIISDGGQE